MVSQSRAWSMSMSTGKRGREEEKETEKEKEEGSILTINRRESERERVRRKFILQSTERKMQKWAGDGERERRRGGGCVLTCTQHTHMSIGNRKHTRILYARAMGG